MGPSCIEESCLILACHAAEHVQWIKIDGIIGKAAVTRSSLGRSGAASTGQTGDRRLHSLATIWAGDVGSCDPSPALWRRVAPPATPRPAKSAASSTEAAIQAMGTDPSPRVPPTAPAMVGEGVPPVASRMILIYPGGGTVPGVPSERCHARPVKGALIPIVALTRGFHLAPFSWSGTRRPVPIMADGSQLRSGG
jgi:hypothetical protein